MSSKESGILEERGTYRVREAVRESRIREYTEITMDHHKITHKTKINALKMIREKSCLIKSTEIIQIKADKFDWKNDYESVCDLTMFILKQNFAMKSMRNHE